MNIIINNSLKFISISIFVIFTILSCTKSNTSKETPNNEYKIVGSVVRFEKTNSDNIDADTIINGKEYYILQDAKYIYNDKNRLIEENNYNNLGQNYHKIIYKYDNNMIIQKNNYYDTDIEDISIYKYDNEGNLIEETLFNKENVVLEKTIRKYKNNKIIEELNDSNHTIKYNYNENGLLISKIIYFNEELSEEFEYEYDDKNRLSKAYNFLGSELVATDEYKYDDKDNMIEESRTVENITSKTIYEYNNNSKLIKETLYVGKNLEKISYFVYDDKNLLTSKRVFGSEDMMFVETL